MAGSSAALPGQPSGLRLRLDRVSALRLCLPRSSRLLPNGARRRLPSRLCPGDGGRAANEVLRKPAGGVLPETEAYGTVLLGMKDDRLRLRSAQGDGRMVGVGPAQAAARARRE